MLRRWLLLSSMLLCAACPRPKEEKRRSPVPATSRTIKRAPRPIPPEPPFGPLEVPDAGFPCDVESVLKAKCRRCHTTPARHGAPFPLMTWDDAQKDFRGTPIHGHMARAVKTGFMPYRIPANPPIELLTDAEKQSIITWAEAGAPRAACPPEQPKKKAKPRGVKPKPSL